MILNNSDLAGIRYYAAYLAFFSEYLREHTPNEALERFIFSSSFNFNPDLAAATAQDLRTSGKDGSEHPQMLNRLMSVYLHPFIHIGYGFEFGIPGQVAEGELRFSVLVSCFNTVLP